MLQDPVDTRELADLVIAARPALDAREQRIGLALYRLLATGAPVAAGQLADSAGVEEAEAERFLAEQPGVHRDDDGQVVAFWGLALGAMPHRLTVGGRELGAWCAWDTLFLPELLGEEVAVASTCPATGAPIDLVVAPDGVRSVSPPGTVLSFLRREQPFDADPIKSFCHFIHFFASRPAAHGWARQHAGTFVLSIDQGAEIARRVNHASFPALSQVGDGRPVVG